MANIQSPVASDGRTKKAQRAIIGEGVKVTLTCRLIRINENRTFSQMADVTMEATLSDGTVLTVRFQHDLRGGGMCCFKLDDSGDKLIANKLSEIQTAKSPASKMF